MLRANRCVICDVTIPPGRRLDRRYCGKNCREVAYRARKKGAGELGRRRVPPGDEAVVWPAAYANIPREVLNVLARHFGQERESLSLELAAARRRIEELERLHAQGSETALAEAISGQRKLAMELEQVKAHATASLDRLTTQLETSQRQQRQTAETLRSLESTRKERQQELAAIAEQLASTRADATAQKERANKSEGELAEARSEITSLKQELAKAESVAQQLADARADIAAQGQLAEHRALDLRSAQSDRANLKQKLAEAERLAEAQAHQISRLEQRAEAAEERETDLVADLELARQEHQRTAEKLAVLERVPHAPQAEPVPVKRPLPEAQAAPTSLAPRSAGPKPGSAPEPPLATETVLRDRAEAEVTRLTRALADTQRQLGDMRSERDQFAQECLTLRISLEERFNEDRLDELTQRGEDMIAQALANLGQSTQARAAAQDHRLHHWTRRALGRRILEALLSERRPIDIEQWARQAVANLRRSAQGSAFPNGLTSWLTTHESFVISAAQGIASSVGTQLALSIPSMCLTAGARTPRNESVGATPPTVIPVPHETVAKRRRRAQPTPATAPSIPRTIIPSSSTAQLPPSLPPPRIESQEEEQSVSEPATTPAWEYDPKDDWLVRWKMDELRTSNELATWQDIRGKPVTAARLVEGKSLREQAMAAAMLARWDYFRNPPSERKTPVCWVQHGFLLDPESEAALRDISSTRNVDMASEVSWLKL